MTRHVLAAIAAMLLLVRGSAEAGAQTPTELLRQVRFDQRLGASLPADLALRDHEGKSVRLGQFSERPVLLALVYFECPMLCTLELNGLVKALKVLDLEPGRDFDLVTVSFNPADTPEKAAAKRANYLRQCKRPGVREGWHFLTGDADQIDRLCEAVGFRYAYDPRTKQFAHASGIVLVTPGGKIARYMFGIEYPPRDLRLGLVEASEGKIGTAADRLLLMCYGYDPATGTYGLLIVRLLRIAGIATVLAIAAGVGWALYRERAAPPAQEASA